MVESKEAEIHRLRNACQELSAALSEIDYALGEPNEMHVSDYDLHCDPWIVVKGVKTKLGI